MALRLRGLASIGCREDTTRHRGCRDDARAGPHCGRCAAASSPSLVAAVLGAVGAGLLVERRPGAAARRPGRPDHHHAERAVDPAARRDRRRVHAARAPRSPTGRRSPTAFTCTGDGVSPALSWTGTPADASSLALVVRDRNAGGFVHWIVTGHRPVRAGHRRGRAARERRRGPQRRRHHRLDRPLPAGRQRRAHLRVRAPRPSGRGGPARRTRPASRPRPCSRRRPCERAVLTGTVTAGGG